METKRKLMVRDLGNPRYVKKIVDPETGEVS